MHDVYPRGLCSLKHLRSPCSAGRMQSRSTPVRSWLCVNQKSSSRVLSIITRWFFSPDADIMVPEHLMKATNATVQGQTAEEFFQHATYFSRHAQQQACERNGHPRNTCVNEMLPKPPGHTASYPGRRLSCHRALHHAQSCDSSIPSLISSSLFVF